jgi:hypothetical protein
MWSFLYITQNAEKNFKRLNIIGKRLKFFKKSIANVFTLCYNDI